MQRETNETNHAKTLFNAFFLHLGSPHGDGLSHLIGDYMVLQQQAEARLWGWARPGQTIKVTTHFFGKPATQSAKADAKGQWLVSVKTPKAGYKPYSITFDDGRDVMRMVAGIFT